MANDYNTTATSGLRAENVSKIVSGFALQAFKMRQLCMVTSSSANSESYYEESKAELTGGTGAAVKGIPRLAAFPEGQPTWAKKTSFQDKYGMQGTISWEDSALNNVDVIARTLLRIGRAVAYAEDVQIESSISGATGINTLAVAQGSGWNAATAANRDPVQNILNAKREIAIDNYDIDDGTGYLVVNPTDYANLLGNSKVVNNPTFKSADVVTSGVVGKIAGLNIIVTNACTISQAYVVKAKEALSLKEAQPLKVLTIEDPGIKYTVRAFEVIAVQVPNPEAICKITNTNDVS